MSDRITELEERIAELEQKLAGQGALQAQRLVIRDESGNERILLDGGGRAGAEIRVLDRQDRVRIRFKIIGEMPVFEMHDSRENSKTWFGVGADGNPTIQLRDNTGRDRLAILVSRRKGAKVSLVDSGGKASTVLAEGVVLADEGIVKKLYLKAEAEAEKAARPHLTVIQGGLSEQDDDDDEAS
jgi:hypothetical protein